MARPSKTSVTDYSNAHELTVGLIERAMCPVGKRFVLLKDADKKGLRLRVTIAGGKHWQFETRLRSGQLFSRALGEWPTISIKDAKEAAHRLRGQTELGIDPREAERSAVAEAAAAQIAKKAKSVTVGEMWQVYLVEGKPKRRDAWKPRYKADLKAMAAAGGKEKKRGKGVTRQGPLYPLMAWTLSAVNEDSLRGWYDAEALVSKHQAARALMMFRGFLRWCATKPNLRTLVDRQAGSAPSLTEALPQSKKRTDALQRDQIRAWWAGVEQLGNRAASVYLRALLLTGARREELAALTWANVDFRWCNLTIADKVEDTRVIPLTPYLATLLMTLPRTNRFVFASTSKSGRITDVRASHAAALKRAGIDYLTIHGLRRSFIQRGRAVVPAGVPAQIAGHKPSATAEGYAILPLDDLRPHADQIEAHILDLAGVQFDKEAQPGSVASTVD